VSFVLGKDNIFTNSQHYIALLGKCGVVHYAISLCNHKSELSSL